MASFSCSCHEACEKVKDVDIFLFLLTAELIYYDLNVNTYAKKCCSSITIYI